MDGLTLTYTDEDIPPGRARGYRVDDETPGDGQVEVFSGWVRSTPFDSDFGEPPEDFGLTEDEVSHDRLREYRLSWEKVDGADGCEVQTVSHGLTTGQEMLEETEVYSSPAFFHPAFGRRHFRVRGRMQDHALGVAQAIWAGVIPAGPGNSLPHVPVQRRQQFQPDRAVPGPGQAADAALGLVLPSEPLEIDHQDGDADLVQVPVCEEPGRGRLAVMAGSGFPPWQVQGFGDIVGVHFMAVAAGLEEFPHWHSLIPSPAPGGRWASAGGRRGSSSRWHP